MRQGRGKAGRELEAEVCEEGPEGGEEEEVELRRGGAGDGVVAVGVAVDGGGGVVDGWRGWRGLGERWRGDAGRKGMEWRKREGVEWGRGSTVSCEAEFDDCEEGGDCANDHEPGVSHYWMPTFFI